MASGPWEYISTENQEGFLAQIKTTRHSPLFYSRQSTLDPEIVKGIPPNESIHRSEINGLRQKFKASFTIDRVNYLNLCITDPDFRIWMGRENSYILTIPTLLLSLSEPFYYQKAVQPLCNIN